MKILGHLLGRVIHLLPEGTRPIYKDLSKATSYKKLDSQDHQGFKKLLAFKKILILVKEILGIASCIILFGTYSVSSGLWKRVKQLYFKRSGDEHEDFHCTLTKLGRNLGYINGTVLSNFQC